MHTEIENYLRHRCPRRNFLEFCWYLRVLVQHCVVCVMKPPFERTCQYQFLNSVHISWLLFLKSHVVISQPSMWWHNEAAIEANAPAWTRCKTEEELICKVATYNTIIYVLDWSNRQWNKFDQLGIQKMTWLNVPEAWNFKSIQCVLYHQTSTILPWSQEACVATLQWTSTKRRQRKFYYDLESEDVIQTTSKRQPGL